MTAMPSRISAVFEPVALVFKDVHYWVKNPNGRGELELLKASALPHASYICGIGVSRDIMEEANCLM